MPTFNWDYCQGEIFDPETTPSQVGVLTEIFRKRPGVLRSISPPWCTFAAIGKHAVDIAGIRATTSFGKDSVLQYLYDVNAKYVLLGCTYNEGAVQVHWLEEKFRVPYRYFKRFEGLVRLGENTVNDVSSMYARRLDADATVDARHLTDIFDKTDKVKIASLGLGKIRSFYTRDYVAFMAPYFEEDKLAVLAPGARESFSDSIPGL
jgi:aminoglycoside 3-N-acetyltransferase